MSSRVILGPRSAAVNFNDNESQCLTMESISTDLPDTKVPLNKQPPVTQISLFTEILPTLYEIIRSIEKDPSENSAKQKESQECSQKVLELQKRLETARAQVRQLPGIEFNKEEQLQRLEILRNQLTLKQQLIKKYRNIQL